MIGSLSGRTAEPHADYTVGPFRRMCVTTADRSLTDLDPCSCPVCYNYLPTLHVYQHHRRRPQFASRT